MDQKKEHSGITSTTVSPHVVSANGTGDFKRLPTSSAEEIPITPVMVMLSVVDGYKISIRL